MSTPTTPKKSSSMPSFRRKKKKSESAGEGSRSAGEGSRSYRRIRGLLTGESRRERKAKRAAERAAAAALGKPAPPVPEGDDEDETVYGVNVENNSVVQTPDRSATAKRGLLTPARNQDDDDEITFETAALQVILLLMDPGTRRFELLQLEFDSNHAIVKDVLTEVPLSVTEEVLRKQNYSGVCDRTGQELYVSTRLSEACGPADILIAIPENVPAMECARLAKPILQDKNVVEMLRSSGVDTTGLENLDATTTPAKSRGVAATPSAGTSKDMQKRTPLIMALVVILAFLIQVTQMSVTAPLAPGQSLSPKSFMSKCGYTALFGCERATLTMNDEGVLTLYGSDGSVEWEMTGSRCDSVSSGCKNGLVVSTDGSLEIGGRTIRSATVYGNAMFSPWPFTESPNIRVVKARK